VSGWTILFYPFLLHWLNHCIAFILTF
jgi:hypothetical protein